MLFIICKNTYNELYHKLFLRCYKSIRYFYPTAHIIIIDSEDSKYNMQNKASNIFTDNDKFIFTNFSNCHHLLGLIVFLKSSYNNCTIISDMFYLHKHLENYTNSTFYPFFVTSENHIFKNSFIINKTNELNTDILNSYVIDYNNLNNQSVSIINDFTIDLLTRLNIKLKWDCYNNVSNYPDLWIYNNFDFNIDLKYVGPVLKTWCLTESEHINYKYVDCDDIVEFDKFDYNMYNIVNNTSFNFYEAYANYINVGNSEKKEIPIIHEENKFIEYFNNNKDKIKTTCVLMASHFKDQRSYYINLNTIIKLLKSVDKIFVAISLADDSLNYLVEKLKEKLQKTNVIISIVENNSMYDFGKWYYLLKKYDIHQYENIIFTNDSFILLREINDYVGFVWQSDKQLIGFIQSFQRKYHYQSYIFSLKKNSLELFEYYILFLFPFIKTQEHLINYGELMLPHIITSSESYYYNFRNFNGNLTSTRMNHYYFLKYYNFPVIKVKDAYNENGNLKFYIMKTLTNRDIDNDLYLIDIFRT